MRKKTIFVLLTLICIGGVVVGSLFFLNKKSVEEDIINTIEMVWNNTETGEEPDFLKEITKRSSYEIVSIEESDVYCVNVVVKGIDVGEQLKALSYDDFAKIQDEKELNQYLLEIIGESKVVETSTVIYAEPVGEGYEISFTDTFVDAMSGKIYSYYMNIANEVLEE